MNENLHEVTISDIESHKRITTTELDRDLNNLIGFSATQNSNSFYGNPTLYHFQLKNLLRCGRENGKTIYEIWNDPVAREKLISDTRKRNRGGRTPAGNVFECFRINLGSIVMFKATTAKYLYKKYNSSHVLDPTAGWGGRLLGAWSLGIDYTGIDTNVELKPAYDEMISYLPRTLTSQQIMIWKSCLDVDFSKIDYDLVLTSPPYVNLELYEHMTPWDKDEDFYKNFLIPLWDKCITNIRRGGKVCLNISPKMYEKAIEFGLPKCKDEEDLKQQLGQQTNKKKQDKIYIW